MCLAADRCELSLRLLSNYANRPAPTSRLVVLATSIRNVIEFTRSLALVFRKGALGPAMRFRNH